MSSAVPPTSTLGVYAFLYFRGINRADFHPDQWSVILRNPSGLSDVDGFSFFGIGSGRAERRRQPFQNAAFEYFQRFTSRRGLP